MRQTQRQLLKDRDRTQAKANFKVGASVAGVIGVGAVMLFTQFLTLGLLTLSTAGGAIAGYAWRARKELARQDPTALPAGRGDKLLGWEGARKALSGLTRLRELPAEEAPAPRPRRAAPPAGRSLS